MRWNRAAMLAGLMAAVAAAQPAPRPEPPAAAAHVERARKLAGSDLPRPLELCDANRSPAAGSFQRNRNNWLEPAKVFDNLYFVGSAFVGVWILETSEGLILIDSLGSADEARDRLIPGMRKLGLDPARIKYVFVTHGHWDHYGGAQYLKDQFGARIGLGEADWNLMATIGLASPEMRNVPPPAKDLVVTDGMKVTLGRTTVTFYVTPGHSPGTISAIVPAREGRRLLPMSLLGGTAFPVTLEPDVHGGGLIGNSRSVQRLASLSKAAGAVGIINTHVGNDGSLERMQALAARRPGQPHPFVIGAGAVARHYGVFDACLQAAIERRKAMSRTP